MCVGDLCITPFDVTFKVDYRSLWIDIYADRVCVGICMSSCIVSAIHLAHSEIVSGLIKHLMTINKEVQNSIWDFVSIS